jgi:ABC-type branched-subunit amino acid transport system substrate-binding protein
MERRHATIDYDRAVTKGAGATEARLVVEEMKLAGITNVFIAARPLWFIQVLKEADTQGFHPAWTGISVTPANDTIVGVSCNGGDSLDGAKFLSPYPAVVDSDRFDDRFRKAVERFYPSTEVDDYMWQLWALERVIAKMLGRSGRELTRSRFIRRVERTDRIYTGVGPTLHYKPNDHFGARDTHLLRASCADRRWHTARSFVHNFK